MLCRDTCPAAPQAVGPSGNVPLDAPLEEGELASWRRRPGPDGGLVLVQRYPVRYVTWHGRGDYLSTVAPTGNTQAVLVHQLSKRATQAPFRKNRGRVARVLFHPTKPFFFVATQNHVRDGGGGGGAGVLSLLCVPCAPVLLPLLPLAMARLCMPFGLQHRCSPY